MNAHTLVSVPKQSLGKGLGFPLRSEPFTYGMSSVAILYVEIYVLYIEIFMGLNIYLWTKKYLCAKKNICGHKNIFVDIKIYLCT